MEQEIKQLMYRIVDDYIQVEDLNTLLKTFIADKDQEPSAWSDITLCTHYMLGGSSPDIHHIAAAAELVILTLDIIDDLQDQDQIGKPWMQCQPAYALNGILAFLIGFMGELGRQQIQGPALAEIASILARSVNGQHKDVNQSSATVDDYLIMTQEKSGSIFRLACFLGVIGLDCSAEALEKLSQFTDCIGLIHQIENDKRDLLRYDVKNDLFSKKRTLPILYLLQVDDPAFSPIKDYYDGLSSTDFLIKHKVEVLQMIHDSGCIEYASIVQSVCIQKAEEIYNGLEGCSPWRERFRELTFGSFV